MGKEVRELPPDQLRSAIDPDSLPFEHTGALEPSDERVLGQERASDAIRFGMGLKATDYHIFVAGPPKTGLTYIARTYLEEQAEKEPIPPDWCYVYNFKEPDKPKHLQLSAGRGKELQRDMEGLIETLQGKIPEVFESEDYQAKHRDLHKGLERTQRKIMDNLSRLAKEEGFVLQVSQVGMVVIPATSEGQAMSQEKVAELSEEEKNRLREKSSQLQEKMKEALKEIRGAESAFKERHRQLDKQIALFVVGQFIETYLEKYKDEPGVIAFLKLVQEDIVENVDEFRKKPDAQQHAIPIPIAVRESTFRKYDINVLIDNSETKGAPVVVETNPSYPNLFGTIERQAQFGLLFTDFTMIKPGSLHKANGGYLVMNALDLLKWYFSWEALKRALRNKEIRIEDLGELYGLVSTKTIRPDPLPLNIKIVLTGDPYLFELLHIYDDRFPKLFKVKAHLDDRMGRGEDTTLRCSQMIGDFCREQNLRHLDRGGVARMLEYSMERAEDREKLSLEVADIQDLIREADYYASLDKTDLVSKGHVQQAIDKRIFRSNLYQERITELIEDDVLWIDTEGSKVGQVNGLSILWTGDYEFGKPNRITATVSVGKEGVVAIERESKMSGNIHTKGVMILTNFLMERFAHNKPVSLTASLCFEQSYGMIEGDSASSTELFALLSALARVPIYQGIAVTGSVSQKGEIQAVGGITRKVEAFFDICRRKGLNGKQGVIIPAKNIRNLLLKEEIIQSVREGRFHVWPIETIEEGVEILTGMEAGSLLPDGTYPDGTLFRRVDDRLTEIAEIVKRFGEEKEEEKPEGEV